MSDPTGENLAPEYVTARRVLLDALTALDAHRENLILVGAQAVYHHTGSSELNIALMTTDGDLAIDTAPVASPAVSKPLSSSEPMAHSDDCLPAAA